MLSPSTPILRPCYRASEFAAIVVWLQSPARCLSSHGRKELWSCFAAPARSGVAVQCAAALYAAAISRT